MPFYSSKERLKRKRIAKESNKQLNIGSGEEETIQPIETVVYRQPALIDNLLFTARFVDNIQTLDYPHKFLSYTTKLNFEIYKTPTINDKLYKILLNVNELNYRIYPNKTFEEIQNDIEIEWYVDGILEQTNSKTTDSFELIQDYIGKSVQAKIINLNNNESWLSETISIDYILNISLNNIISLNFKNGDKVSRYGLTQSESDSLYSGTNLDGKIEIINNGVQRYKIPETAGYKFECLGAKGGGNYGGKGAYMSGIFYLYENTYIQVGCGNQGTWNENEASGGGASWVAKELSDGSLDLLLIAGGGGGSANVESDLAGGSILINGNKSDTNDNNHPGVNGSGGNDENQYARNGAGWYFGSRYQPAIKDDPRGGRYSTSQNLDGGFGGGGACRRYYDYVSGGGGYSGGEGGRYGSQIGGGGGSFNKGRFQDNIANYNNTHGKVSCEYYSSTIDDYFEITSTPQISKKIIGDVLFLVTDFDFEHFQLFNLEISDLNISYKWYKDGVEITNSSYTYEIDLTNDVNSDFYVELTNNKTGNIYTTNTITINSSDTDFDINKLEGLNLYLDANNDNSLMIDANNNVSEWQDQISGLKAIQSDSSLQPVKQIDSWNNHNTVYFSNDQQLIINPDFQTQNNYWFFLIKLETTHSNIAVGGSPNSYLSLGQDGSTHNNSLTYVDVNNEIIEDNHIQTINYLFTGVNKNVNERQDVYNELTITEGVVYGVENFPAIFNDVSLGSSSRSGSWYANGEFQAIICINGNNENADYISKQIESFLAHKVGIETNLPTDHPYKSNSPTYNNGGTSSASIIQNGLNIEIDSLNYYVFPNKSSQQMADDGDIYIKWFMDGVEVVGETDATLPLDQDNGDQGKSVYSEATNNVDASVITSNTITVEEIFVPTNYLQFDGIDDYVSLDYYYNSTNIGSFTVESWVKVPSDGGNWSILDFDRSEYFTCCAGIPINSVNGNGDYIGFHTDKTGGGGDMWSSYSTIRDNEWHHIAWVFDSSNSTKYIYIDGALDSTQTINSSAIGTGITRYGFIGDGSEATSLNGSRNDLYFKGSIYNLRVWNTARTNQQIIDNMEIELSGSESNLEANYLMTTGTGSTLNDSTSNNRDGTIYGATWVVN